MQITGVTHLALIVEKGPCTVDIATFALPLRNRELVDGLVAFDVNRLATPDMLGVQMLLHAQCRPDVL